MIHPDGWDSAGRRKVMTTSIHNTICRCELPMVVVVVVVGH